MNLLIFGASGGTGRCLVEQALAQGHQVTAFTRNAAKIRGSHPSQRVVEGNVQDYAAVSSALQGQDAVISALGIYQFKKNTVLSDITRTIVRAMETHGPKRFIFESSLGIADTRDQLGLFTELVMYPLFLRHIFPDKERQELVIRNSHLDWVIVRPAFLTNGPRTGRYRHGFGPHEKINHRISRADTAEFMLKQLADNTYLRQTPGVSY